MDEILEIASKVSTPLALGGLFAAIFFLTLRQIIAKDIFPSLTKALGGDILKMIIERLFILALVALILGFAGFVLTRALPDTTKPPDSITVTLPSNMKLRAAIKFLAEIEGLTVDFGAGCDESLMNSEVEGGQITGRSTTELIELLRLRLKEPKPRPSYKVTLKREKGIYEISCV